MDRVEYGVKETKKLGDMKMGQSILGSPSEPEGSPNEPEVVPSNAANDASQEAPSITEAGSLKPGMDGQATLAEYTRSKKFVTDVANGKTPFDLLDQPKSSTRIRVDVDEYTYHLLTYLSYHLGVQRTKVLPLALSFMPSTTIRNRH